MQTLEIAVSIFEFHSAGVVPMGCKSDFQNENLYLWFYGNFKSDFQSCLLSKLYEWMFKNCFKLLLFLHRLALNCKLLCQHRFWNHLNSLCWKISISRTLILYRNENLLTGYFLISSYSRTINNVNSFESSSSFFK